MKIQSILKELEFNDGTFPRQALEAAIASREQIIPELLKIVQDTTQRANVLLHQHNYMAHFYALYLLAQFREKRAYPLIVDLFSIPGDITLDLTGDLVTEDLGRILASVCCGDTSLIMSLAENENANEYVRNAALRGLIVLVACGEKPREEVITHYQGLFQKFSRKYSHAWNGLVDCSTDLYPEEMYDDIKQAFKDNLIDPHFIDLGFVEKTLALGKEKVLERLQDQRHSLIEDTIKEMEWWACFKAPKRRPVVEKKVGRNKPCPCGSGKKYKHCCGARR